MTGVDEASPTIDINQSLLQTNLKDGTKILKDQSIKEYAITQEEIDDMTIKKPCGKPLGVYDASNKCKKQEILKETVDGEKLELLEYYSQNQCPYKMCGKKFAYQSSLVHHLKIH